MITDVGGNTIGFAKRSQQLSLYLSEKLMSEHGYTRFKIKKISKRLNGKTEQKLADKLFLEQV